MNPIRVLLVDDQKLMREGLRVLLEMEPDLEVVSEAPDGEAALAAYAEQQPDVVLMDIRMPGMDGVEATRRLRERWPEVRVIILTTFDDDEYVFEGLRAGALGYLLKDVSGHELAEAIRTVAEGGALIEPSVARKVVAEFARLAPPARPPDAGLPEPLTEREQEARNPDSGSAPVGPGAEQPGDRPAALPGGGHGEELRHQHPGEAGRA